MEKVCVCALLLYNLNLQFTSEEKITWFLNGNCLNCNFVLPVEQLSLHVSLAKVSNCHPEEYIRNIHTHKKICLVSGLVSIVVDVLVICWIC